MSAETEIDKLALDISVKDTTDGESASKKVASLARAIVRLQTAVQNFDNRKFRAKFSTMANAIKPFTSELKSAKSALIALDRLMSKTSLSKVAKAIKKPETETVETNTNPSGEQSAPQVQDGKPSRLKTLRAEKAAVHELTKKYGDLIKVVDNADGTQTHYFSRTKNGVKTVSQVAFQVDKNGKVIANSEELVSKTSTKTTSAFTKLFNSIKRVALYRAIRTALKIITSSLKEGIENVALFDKSTERAMSQATSSMTSMKNALGVVIAPLLQAATPLIQSISNAVVNLANSISHLTAKIRGENKYLKVSTDYLEKYNKQSKLLGFDNFSVLDNGNNIQNMFEYGDTEEDLNKTEEFLLEIFGLVKEIGSHFASIWDTLKKSLVSFMPAIKAVASAAGTVIEGVVKIVAKVVGWIAKGIEWLNKYNLLVPLLYAIAAAMAVILAIKIAMALVDPFAWVKIAIVAIAALVALIVAKWDWIKDNIFKPIKDFFVKIGDWFKQLWGKIKDFCNKVKTAFLVVVNAIKQFFVNLWHGIANGFAAMINGIVNGFVALVNLFIDGINAILKPIDKIAGWFGGNAQIPHWNYSMNWKPYAEGGVFNKGTAFIAGEAGAEVVYNNKNGSGGVLNIEQFKLAMLSALSDYGAARGADVQIRGEVLIDGGKAGQLVEKGVYSEGIRVGHFARK